MQIDISRFRDAFFEDAAEHLATLESGLLNLESRPRDTELLNSIFRSAHSIKGASGTFGFPDVARFTHVLESVLERLRAGEIAATSALTDALLRSADVLGELLDAARRDAPPPARAGDVAAELDRIASGVRPAASAEQVETHLFEIELEPSLDLLRTGTDPLLLLRDLEELGELLAAEPDLTRIPALGAMDPERCYLRWRVTLATPHGIEAVREVFVFVEDDCRFTIRPLIDLAVVARTGASLEEGQVPPPSHASSVEPGSVAATGAPHAPTAVAPSSIRVPTARVDELVNLVGELVIAQAAVTQVIQDFTIDRLAQLEEAVAALERNTRDVQEKVLKIRMLPIRTVFSRFPRLVRDLAGTMGKEIALHMSGEETELDKEVIERIGDPLLHLVRNAVDHGIETPDERRAAGKPTQATVIIRATQEGGTIVIEVADDGRGLDTAAIRRTAVAAGIVGEGEALTEEQVHALIFRPGLSTARVVSDVSGRGVGMDVVKRNIEELGGSLGVTTAPGRGTRFHIRLPLTLAILDGLSVAVARQTYVLPLLSVLDSFRPRVSDTRRLADGAGEIVMWRGESLALIRVHRLFELDGAVTEPTRAIVVVIEEQGRRFGLLVDDLIGQCQVVIKSLEANYRRLEGIAGATILGDGNVALILDVHDLVQRLSGSAPGAPSDRGEPSLAATHS